MSKPATRKPLNYKLCVTQDQDHLGLQDRVLKYGRYKQADCNE